MTMRLDSASMPAAGRVYWDTPRFTLLIHSLRSSYIHPLQPPEIGHKQPSAKIEQFLQFR